ncbi:AMP-binding protein [Kineobactrum salinum]|uniref:AMP-binding protein n=1 Tax=Kineobactrum salinum TaxID=2708301 RepID=A0A6C0TYQ7_9GAMM|nr:AMP-binding protein [Kineobactrum salinum]QIB64960.1 AMP-binding protein [Kineobactrum salinum]
MIANSLYETLRQTEIQHGDRPAIRFIEAMDQPSPSLEWDYRSFMNRIRGGANLFRRCGVEEAATVALLVPNTPYAQVALFAAEIAGRALPVNPLLSDDHIVSLLAAAGAKVLVMAEDPMRAESLRARLQELRHIFTLEDGPANFADAVAQMSAGALDFSPTLDPSTVVAAFHTGGTTGSPKLALHTQTNQLAVARAIAPGIDLRPTDVLVNALPLFHVAGPMCFALTAMVAGACQLLCTAAGARHPDFIGKHWTMLENQRVTMLGGVPTTIGALVPTIPDNPPPRLRRVITGGAMLPTAVETAFVERLGLTPVIIYGMTECAGLLALRGINDMSEPGWTGKAIPGMEIRIVGRADDVAGTRLPPLETGHVVARGCTVGPGYSDPGQNEAAFTADGWLITGDLGMMDEQGNLQLTGRAKDLIIRSGHNVDPTLIEEAAIRFPGVAAAAAVGAPDAYAGELPVLFVVPEEHAGGIDPDALIASIRMHVERPAVPKWVEIVDVMPLTAVGKIYKPALVARAAERVLTQALAANKLPCHIAVEVTEQKGVSHAIFRARDEDQVAIGDLMAPFALAYTIIQRP